MKDGRKLTSPFRTLRGKLFLYMLIVSAAIVTAIFIGYFMIGRSESTGKVYNEKLSFQMDVFRRDVFTRMDSLELNTSLLAEETRSSIASYLNEKNIRFADLNDNLEAIESLETILFQPLMDRIYRTGCSGAFIILNTTVNSKIENAGTSKSGLYLRNGEYNSSSEELVLYRGEVDAADLYSIMPHRKWKLEFDTRQLPFDFDDDSVRNGTVTLSSMMTLPGTSERSMLIYTPLYLDDGTYLGVCGYELSQSFFKTALVQPSSMKHLSFLACRGPAEEPDTAQCFSCGILNGYYLAPSGSFSRKKISDGLYRYTDSTDSYVDMQSSLALPQNAGTMELYVMAPETDFKSDHIRYLLENTIIVLLLLGIAVFFGFFMSRRYVKPVLQSIADYKEGKKSDSSVQEIDDLFAFLENKDIEHEREMKRLAYSRKKEVDPDQYQLFLQGMESLTPTEKEIFQLYMEGKGTKEIMQIKNIKESTLRYHNRNIYSKLGINSLKQMLRYASIMVQEKKDGAGDTHPAS